MCILLSYFLVELNWRFQQLAVAKLDEFKETIETFNYSLEDKEVHSNESNEKSKDIESDPVYFILTSEKP